MKYFLPDWEDRLDPNFDFFNDCYSDNHKKNPYENDYYAHQLFGEPPYDGILVSLGIFQKKLSLSYNGDEYEIKGKTKIKDYLKINKNSNLEVMGDCGAFSYVKEKEPPKPFYNIENIANLYQSLGFDYGVSVDHLAVDYILLKNLKTGKREKVILSTNEKDRRIDITLKNAVKFLDLHEKMDYTFVPVGVAQGYDINTYKNSFKSLIDMGYNYIALGGLVQYRTKFIIKILEAIQPYPKNISLHLFGVLRPEHLENFKKLGVNSFDSASFFRKAWLRSEQNYLSKNGKWYTSIRVPQSSNPRILKNANLNGFSIQDIQIMEKEALDSLFAYDNGNIEIEEVLDSVIRYDELLLRNSNDGDNLRRKYKKTLMEMPWKDCDCPMCKSLGINIMIFRGTNRNKRRGFHNIWALRNGTKEFQTHLNLKNKSVHDIKLDNSNNKSSLCIVPCGNKKIWDKNPKAGPTKAEKVYIGSFSKKCQEYAKKFHNDSWYILSAKYGFLSLSDVVEGPYNVTFNDLKTNPISKPDLIYQINQKNLDQYDKIVVVAGKKYLQMLKEVFPDKKIENPLDGCAGIGFMMKRLNNLINS